MFSTKASCYALLRKLSLAAITLLTLSTARAQLDQHALASRYFGNDAPWYEQNIPFLEIDDPEIQDTYYYRWQVYRSHLRDIGPQGVTITEFLPDVPWARQPYTDLNDSSSFHIREGRWLRNPAIVASLIDHLYAGGGNDRHFSEWNAAATLDFVRVTGDAAPALRNLAAMRQTYELWDDHRDFARDLYWIEPLADATEYTISSIDASGAGFTDHPSTDQNGNGFTRGYAFRPSINSYQYANALAIADFADRTGDHATAQSFRERAAHLRAATLKQLWNPALQHFTDIYQRSTPTVKQGEFIRGRELVGYTPWMFGLPLHSSTAAQPDYNAAWQHVLIASQLAGPHGLRTVEPSYPKYMAQYRYDAATGKSECQWNGPTWPFQSSQTLTGMANLLQQDPTQTAITRDQYVALLRQYTAQHRLANGTFDIEEDLNPDTGAPIVGLERSHHYNHSTYNDLILSGLIGIQPREDDTLQLTPLLPSASDVQPIRYFALQSLRYHGRTLSIRYDADGTHYHQGRGYTVECERRRLLGPALPDATTGSITAKLCAAPAAPPAQPMPNDVAVNVFERSPSAYEYAPRIIASSSAPGRDPWQAIDGRLWFFPEVPNGWSPEAGDSAPGFTLTLPQAASVRVARFAFFDDGAQTVAPQAVTLSIRNGDAWTRVASSAQPVANGITELRLPASVRTADFRIDLTPVPDKTLRVIEVELF